MKVGFFQFNPRKGDPIFNRDYIISHLKNIDADLIVLPELAFSGYLIHSKSELLDLSFQVNDDFFLPLIELCRSNNMTIVFGFSEKDLLNDHVVFYNSAMMISNKGFCFLYRKNHLFDREKLLFEPGNLGFPLFEVAGVKIGLLICFDHMFPEAARTLALKGAQVICHPSNLVLPGYAQITTQARALENRLYWILANRYGTETENIDGEICSLTYSGESRMISPTGKVIAEAQAEGDSIVIHKIFEEESLNKNLGERNNLFDDRRSNRYFK